MADASAPLTFAAFLEKMRNPAASDIVKAIKSFLNEFGNSPPAGDRDGERVQAFLATTEAVFRTHPLWRGVGEEELEASGEGLEKYLLTKLHARTFAVVAEDVERDTLLAQRLEALQFITPENLEIPARHSRAEQPLQLAQKELAKINTYKAPRDKLVCVLNCCRVINNLLVSSAAKDSPPGADDFLPLLVYVLLRAQPPQLASNLAFIMRFRLASRLVSEASYYFTNLMSATHFLETADASQFKGVSATEFTRRLAAAGLPPPTSGPSPSSVHAPLLDPASLPRGSRGSNGSDSQARWSVEELSAVGAAMLASSGPSNGGRGVLASRHRFFGLPAPNLTLAQVPVLLSDYEALASRHEALLLGVTLMLEEVNAAPAPSRAVAAAAPKLESNMFEGLSLSGGAPAAPVAAAVAAAPPDAPVRVASSGGGLSEMVGGSGGSSEALDVMVSVEEGASLVAAAGPPPTEPARMPELMIPHREEGGSLI